jgi:hypothetical protein
MLVLNFNLPNVMETLCSVAIVWINLAYLLVTVPLFVARLRHRQLGPLAPSADATSFVPADGGHGRASHSGFSLGRWGMPIHAIAVVWGLISAGSIYFVLFQRNQTGILAEHSANGPETAVVRKKRWPANRAPFDRSACTG